MLQLPETTRQARSTYRAALPQPKKQKRASALEKAIADHKAAARVLRNRTADEKRLHDAHPDLADFRPSVLFWTKGDGTKCYGTMLHDFNKVFPPSLDKISPGNVKARKKFLADLAAALPEHQRQRRRTGIARAESQRYKASRKEFGAFRRFIKVVPTTRAQLRRYTRYLLHAVTGRVGGKISDNISTTQFSKMGISWDDFKERQRDAFHDLYRALVTLATRA